MLTILITTFKRPKILQRLLSSLPLSIKQYIWADPDDDVGVSFQRNSMVKMAETEYVAIIEDDCIFTEHTDLNKAVDILKRRDLDILGIDCGVDYKGTFETKDGIVTYKRSDGPLYDFIPQIFVAKRQALLDHPWDESLKIGEHFAFFYTHRGKMKIGWTDEVSIIHDSVDNPDYLPYRNRGIEYVKKYMRENNIKVRVDLHGERIEV